MNQLEILLQHPFVMQRIKEERKKQGYDESLEPCLDEDGDIMFKDNASLSGFSWVLSTEGFDVWEKLFIYKDMSQFYRFYGLPEPKTINILNPIDASEARNSFIGEEKLPITDRKSTRLNSSHITISYAVFCLK